jgi:hypothetical protein
VSVTVVHATLGTLLVVAGVAASLTPKRRRRSPHRRIGRLYVGLLVVVLPTGMVIGAADPAITLFEVATPPTLAMGLGGWWAGRARPRRFLGQPWRVWHIAGMGGSLIGVITATAFQLVPRIVAMDPVTTTAVWLVPTLVGSVLISRATARWTAPPRAPAEAAVGGGHSRR